MNMINVKIKRAYGVNRIYPDGYNANLFAKLIGKKTFSPYDLYTIMELGFELCINGERAYTHHMLPAFKQFALDTQLYN